MSMLFQVTWANKESDAYDRHHSAVLLAGSREGAILRVRKELSIPKNIKVRGRVVRAGIFYKTWIGDPE